MDIVDEQLFHPLWKDILDTYFKANGFVKHQLDSYNDFVETGIQKVLDELGSIEIKTGPESRGGEAKYIIKFGKITMKKPVIREHDGTTNVLYPQEARNRNLTYHSSLYCDIKVTTIKNNEIVEKNCKEQLGYIPIMVKSKFCLLYGKTEKELKELGECVYDEGGYFIVNGNEKAIIAQERMPHNMVYCFYKKPPSKIIWQSEIRSNLEYHVKTTSTFYIRTFSKGIRSGYDNSTFTDIDGLRGQITYIKQDLPIIFIFYSLGIVSKNDIIDIITNARIPLDTADYDSYFKNIVKFLRCSFDEADEIIRDECPDCTQLELQNFCLEYIGKRGSSIKNTKEETIEYAVEILNKELLPHLNTNYEDIFKKDLQLTKTKAHFIGYMINKIYLCYTGVLKEDDRDHLANKRVELTGNLLTSLFKNIFKRLYKEAKSNLTKSIESNNNFDLMNNIKSKSITNDIKYALSTGNWGRQVGGTPPKAGVAQQLNRLTFSSSLSHLRRLNTPLNREGKQAKPRQLHNTHFGYCCCGPDTSVLLHDGKLITLEELIRNGDNMVITVVNPNTREITSSNIVAFQKFISKEFNKKILKISTRSGRSIKVTDDHRFAIPGGDFTEAGDLTVNDKVLIKSEYSLLSREYFEYRKINTDKYLTYKEYIIDTEADLENITYYDRISKIEEIPIENCPVVMDLTTSSDIHTFVSNGFVTHNCPCETPEGQACIEKTTTVQLPNGDLIPISDLEETYIDSSILTVDIGSRKSEPTNIHSFQKHDTKKYNNKVIKITTISGRSIVLTTDHPFAVPGDTFVEAGNIKIGDKVLVSPTPINQLQNEIPVKEVLNKEKYKNIIGTYNLVKEHTILTDIIELEKVGLLPLINNDKRLSVISGLIGYCDTDGNITKCVTYSMGCKEDMEAIKNSVYSLGFGTTSEGIELIKTRTLTNGRKINETVWKISLSANLSRLLIALGAMVGRKTTQESKIPQFLQLCSLRVKASYLSALFGGDGDALNYVYKKDITRKSPRWSISPPGFGNTKVESLKDNLENYLEEIRKMLLEFGIETRDIKEQSSTENDEYNQELENEGKETKIKKRFYVSSSYTNLIKFADNIEFKWCKHKQNKLKITSEYIRYLQYYIDQISIKRLEVLKLHQSGIGPTEISKQIGIPLKRVEHMLYSKTYETVAIPRDYVKWPEYLKNTGADFETGTLYDTVAKIDEVSYEDCPVVMDLTTESENHTFITGGFVTHNCGLLKNFSITCHISIGSEKTHTFILKFLEANNAMDFIGTRDMISETFLYKIFLDGAWILSVDTTVVKLIVKKLKNFRRKLVVHYDTCIALNEESKELNIFTGSGRCCRPLILIENMDVSTVDNMSWDDLLCKGIVEYIDIAEEEELMIAVNAKQIREFPNKYTHLEIHPCTMLGICASIIPFPDHNQCILYTSHVLMADGTTKMIKDIKIGESVVTFNPDTLERSYSKVEYHMVKETEKKMYKITTLSGREMIATFDHRFWTNDGFMKVEDFNENTKLAINLVNKKEYIDKNVKILDRDIFVKTCEKYPTMMKKTIDRYSEEISRFFGEIDGNKVSILAGIIGYLLADGSLSVSTGSGNVASFCHSNMDSAIELQNDMEYIGFDRKTITKNTRTDIFGKDTESPREITQTTYDHSYSGKFPIMLEALGVTTGKRTTQKSTIPEFILNGNKEIQRSFLSGLFGGDGSKVRYDEVRENGEQVEMKYISMAKIPECIESLEIFMKNIEIMLHKFDIKTNYIHTVEGQYGKKIVRLGFNKSCENIIKFYENIGFKYDILKNQESGILVEYLKYKTIIQKKRIDEINEIRKDIDDNFNHQQLVKKYKKTSQEIGDIKQGYKRNDGIGSSKKFKDFMSIKDFFKICTVSNNTLFIPFKIEEYTECNIIADITVESENHTFMANDFLVHNSPRNIYQSAMGYELRDLSNLKECP